LDQWLGLIDPTVPNPLLKYVRIRQNAHVLVFIDENEGSIEDGNFGLDRSPSVCWLNMPATRHNQAATLSFSDGHVEKYRWLWPKVWTTYDSQVVNAKDLKDLQKLQTTLPDPP
jgi:prepilin-type processing-associated H-X9-DG protein